MPGADLRALVECLVRGLVDDPGAVGVKATERDRLVIIGIRVAAGDLGQVIGRRGRIVGAIRTMVRAAALPDGRRVIVEIEQQSSLG